MRFYGESFDYYWHMDARRFFVLHNAMCKLDAIEKIDAVDIQAVAICGVKYIEGLKNRYAEQFDGEGPNEEETVRAEINDEQTTSLLMERLADFKRVNFGR